MSIPNEFQKIIDSKIDDSEILYVENKRKIEENSKNKDDKDTMNNQNLSFPKKISSIELYNQYNSVYGIITISYIAKLISLEPEFSRMQNLKQLGPLHFKFRFADHNRYDHSFGTAHLSRYTASKLQEKHSEITDMQVLCVELAGFCHDIGHGPFSHTFDHLLNNVNFTGITSHHEARSQILFKYIIQKMNKKYNKIILPDEYVKLVQYFIEPSIYRKHIYPKNNESDDHPENLPYFYSGLEQIVSNSLHKVDVDKMDYLVRDGHLLRADQFFDKPLDVEGLLERSDIIDKIWHFHIRDRNIIYDLICRRFLFYTNRYLHPEIHAISCMLIDALTCLDKINNFTNFAKLENESDILKFCELTDNYLIEIILNSLDEKLKEAKKLITNIINKKDLYIHIGDYAPNEYNIDTSLFIEIPWNIYTDESTPTNLLPNVRYHFNGKSIDHSQIPGVKRIYMKNVPK